MSLFPVENEMVGLLAADVENQQGQGRVVEMQRVFQQDPETFVRNHLIPTEQTVLEKGYHSLMTR